MQDERETAVDAAHELLQEVDERGHVDHRSPSVVGLRIALDRLRLARGDTLPSPPPTIDEVACPIAREALGVRA